MLLYLRMVFLQDTVFRRRQHSEHAVYAQHPMFSCPIFREWWSEVWVPLVIAYEEDGKVKLAEAKESPPGPSELGRLMRAIIQEPAGSPEQRKSAEKMHKAMQAAELAAQQKQHNAAPFAQPSFADVPSRPSFSSRQDVQDIWDEVTVGAKGRPPLLDVLDTSNFRLSSGIKWDTTESRKAWTDRMQIPFAIFRSCGSIGLKGAALRASGQKAVAAMQAAMHQHCTKSVVLMHKALASGGELAISYRQILQGAAALQ